MFKNASGYSKELQELMNAEEVAAQKQRAEDNKKVVTKGDAKGNGTTGMFNS